MNKISNIIELCMDNPIFLVIVIVLAVLSVKFYIIDPYKKETAKNEQQKRQYQKELAEEEKAKKIKDMIDSMVKKLDDYYERNLKAAEGLVVATGFLSSFDNDTIEEFKAYIGNGIDLENMRIKMTEALEISVSLGSELGKLKEKLLNSDPLANKKEIMADFEKIDEHIMIVKNAVSNTDFINLINFYSKYIEERANLLNS